jgi:hypothetical protein
MTEPSGNVSEDLENFVVDLNDILRFSVKMLEKQVGQEQLIERQRKDLEAISSTKSESERNLQELLSSKSLEYVIL